MIALQITAIRRLPKGGGTAQPDDRQAVAARRNRPSDDWLNRVGDKPAWRERERR